MNQQSKLPAIVAYIGWIGLLIAVVIRDKTDNFTRQHINQSLVLNLATVVSGLVTRLIPLIGKPLGSIISIAALVFWIMGIVRAVKGSAEPLPLIGDVQLIQ